MTKQEDDVMDDKLLAQTTEVFSIFDKDQDGAISIEEIGAVLRSIGFNPTEREIHDIQNSFHQQYDEELMDFPAVLEIVGKFKREGDSYEELLEAFRVFDPNRTGYISAADLRLSMMNFGEHLTEGEADGLISYADVDRRGKIRYIDFAKSLLKD